MHRDSILMKNFFQYLCLITHLLPLDILHGGIPRLRQQLGKPVDLGLNLSNLRLLGNDHHR